MSRRLFIIRLSIVFLLCLRGLSVAAGDGLWPGHVVVQNAGNMGIVSAGAGWEMLKKRAETQLLFGYIPAHRSSRGKVTTTLKFNYLPFSFSISPTESRETSIRKGWTLQPLTASLYVNTVYGHEFWGKQPARYPDGYYSFLSTRMRLNAAFGSRLTWKCGSASRCPKSVSLFYEIGTCDLYVRSFVEDSSVSLGDILSLSLGVRLSR